MKITRTMRSVACILVIAMFITLPVAALSSATTTKTANGYSYTFESRISHWESDPPKIRGSVYISVGNYKEVPGTYIGGLVRIYSSSGVLVMSGDWSYADAFPGDVAGCEWNDYYDPANTPQYSYYYSKGRVKLYNGNGYNYYDCNATPDIASNANNMMTIQKNENGEIYGSEYFLNQIGVEPDLILTCGENGVEGFVRAEDLNYDPVETLQDVITYQETRAIKRSIPLYAAVGETVIGSFTVDNSNVCANSF